MPKKKINLKGESRLINWQKQVVVSPYLWIDKFANDPSDRPLSLTKFTSIWLFEGSSRFYEVKKPKISFHSCAKTRATRNSIPPRSKISFHWAFKIIKITV